MTKQETINSMSAEIKRLREDNQRLRRVNKTLTMTRKKPFSCSSIKTDAKMNFYTGIASIALFQALFNLLRPYSSDINYWQGAKKMSSTRLRRNAKSNKSRKLSLQDEFLLTLMRLRLNLLNTHLADCFDISTGLCSQIFTTWIKILSKILGDALIVWLPKECVRQNLPTCFRTQGYSKCRIIIDCSEVFIERPKSLELQYITWSEYNMLEI